MAERAKATRITTHELELINILLAQIDEFCTAFRPLDDRLQTDEAIDVFAEAVSAMVHRVGVRIDTHLEGGGMGWGRR